MEARAATVETAATDRAVSRVSVMNVDASCWHLICRCLITHIAVHYSLGHLNLSHNTRLNHSKKVEMDRPEATDRQGPQEDKVGFNRK
jgi:hypothetical protein